MHQVPDHSITSPDPATRPPLVPFARLAATVIPRQPLCNSDLTLLVPPYRLLAHPVRLSHPSYPRNEFLFSVALLLPRGAPFAAHRPVVAKLATLLATLETESRYLSADPSPPNTGRLYALCEVLRADLNAHAECLIPLADARGAVLNLRLAPARAPPPRHLAPHHVPLLTAPLAAAAARDPAGWDLTVQRVLPHVDGVNSLAKVAWRADVDDRLARAAVAHLVYYGAARLLDVFSFAGAAYGVAPEVAGFVADAAAQREARAYVLRPEAVGAGPGGAEGPGSGSRLEGPERGGEGHRAEEEAALQRRRERARQLLGGARLLELYASLGRAPSVRAWCMGHAEAAALIDVRRFVTYGVVKGFLYRVHKYAVAGGAGESSEREDGESGKKKGKRRSDRKRGLEEFLDGAHCFDEICTELRIPERELLERLDARGDVQIFQR